MGPLSISPSFPNLSTKTTQFHFSMSLKCSQLLPFTLTLILLLLPFTAAANEPFYSSHCEEFLPAPPLNPNTRPAINIHFLSLYRAHVAYSANETNTTPRSLSFTTNRVYKTQNEVVFKIEGLLSLIGAVGYPRRGLRLAHIRSPRIPRRHHIFSSMGFWDSVSGKLCMIGSGSGSGKSSSNQFVLKLDYSNSSSIFNSLVNGTFESWDSSDPFISSPKLWSVLGVNLRNYKYELIDKEIENNGFLVFNDMVTDSLGIEDIGQKVCRYIKSAGIVELEYRSDCKSVNCNFLGRKSQVLPSIMQFNEIECLDDGKVRFLLGFQDYGYNGYQKSFEPNVTLVTEGKWDGEKKRLNMVGCRIFSDSNDFDFVGECLIRLSLKFPSKWTLINRSSLVGELWSSRSVNESGYFGRVSFTSTKNKNARSSGLRYSYTEIDKATGSCESKTTQKIEGVYPDAFSSDMRFDMAAGNKKLKDLWGYSSPLYVDNQRYGLANSIYGGEPEVTSQVKRNLSNVINISYVMSLSSSEIFNLNTEFTQVSSVDISAEGTYNSKNGRLCMIGCMHISLPKAGVMRWNSSSLDCEILIDISYTPLDQGTRGTVKGTIKSMRKNSDSLYFEPLEITSRSVYSRQAKESIWRMDLEITMVLISNTLSCLFIGMQLLHVKRHSDALPSISVLMLVALTLAHMIPLLLNFEALFKKGHDQNVYFGTDGWLEVNEVLVRVITMVVFLLEFRLLQMAWSARSASENPKKFWVNEKKVLYLSIPLYVSGALIAWLTHKSRRTLNPYMGYKQKSVWGEFKSYAGLILDGFLLPQILFNIFSDSKEKSLAPLFYVGMSFVRLMPHAYDLYRSHSGSWSLNYIYANPRMDYYSTTWDIVISIGSLVLVVLVYLQQRFGGRCFIPTRFKQVTTSYEKVPVVNSEQL